MHELTQLNSIYHINHLHSAIQPTNQFLFFNSLRCCWPLSDGWFPCVIKCLNECCSLLCVIILISGDYVLLLCFSEGGPILLGRLAKEDQAYDQSLGDQLLPWNHAFSSHLFAKICIIVFYCFCVTFRFLITFSARWEKSLFLQKHSYLMM